MILNTITQKKNEFVTKPLWWSCWISVYRPDSVSQVVPAEVDGSGAVLDGLVEGQRTGAGQVHTGLLCVAV